MSDQSFTTHAHLAHAPHRSRTPRAEYLTYFTLIVALALVVQTLGWVWSAVRHLRLPDAGPLSRALRDAEEITPAIFRP